MDRIEFIEFTFDFNILVIFARTADVEYLDALGVTAVYVSGRGIERYWVCANQLVLNTSLTSMQNKTKINYKLLNVSNLKLFIY